jgi:hypothetical protein
VFGIKWFDEAASSSTEVVKGTLTNSRYLSTLTADRSRGLRSQWPGSSPPAPSIDHTRSAGHHPITANRNRRRRGRKLGHDPARHRR